MHPRQNATHASGWAGLLLALTITSSLATADQHLPGEGVSVTPARATWDTGWFPAAVYSQLLEALGYEVDRPTTLDNPPFYQSVA
ncbi:MAG: glycine betaine ABC transporter substrate-binding protein, partial [Halomonas sp.]|nr:glycine betaine ABC transporter substrate-binding protein [Halomonas sp.]